MNVDLRVKKIFLVGEFKVFYFQTLKERERAKRWRVGSPFFSNTHFKPSVCFFSIKCHLKFHSSFACDDIAGWILSPAYYTFIWSLSFNAFRFLERAKMSHFSFIFSAQYSKKGDFATALTIDDIINVDFSRLFLFFACLPYVSLHNCIWIYFQKCDNRNNELILVF